MALWPVQSNSLSTLLHKQSQMTHQHTTHFPILILKEEDAHYIINQDLTTEIRAKYTELLMEYDKIFHSAGEVLQPSDITVDRRTMSIKSHFGPRVFLNFFDSLPNSDSKSPYELGSEMTPT